MSKSLVFHSALCRRLRAGELVDMTAGDFPAVVGPTTLRTWELLVKMNNGTSLTDRMATLSEILQKPIPPTTFVFLPFCINFGPNTFLGERVIINNNCIFLDLGGIYIGDDVMIAPRVSILTESHPVYYPEKADGDSTLTARRRYIQCKPVHVESGAWIGAGATLLPGVTVGKDSVIAAGAVVSKSVPPRVVAAGTPAKVVCTLEEYEAKRKARGANTDDVKKRDPDKWLDVIPSAFRDAASKL